MLKVVFVAIILFLGAAMAIVYFYEDVNMKGTLEKNVFNNDWRKEKKTLYL